MKRFIRSSFRLCAFILLVLVRVDAQPLAATKVVVRKSDRTITLLHGQQVLRTFSIVLGREPLGAKEKQGDGKTPEGIYRIDSRNEKSGFHRALHISYPNEHDRKLAAAKKLNPGGDIMIHGIENGLGWLGPLHRLIDWTDGCIGLTDAEMDEVWKLVPVGTEIEILP